MQVLFNTCRLIFQHKLFPNSKWSSLSLLENPRFPKERLAGRMAFETTRFCVSPHFALGCWETVWSKNSLFKRNSDVIPSQWDNAFKKKKNSADNLLRHPPYMEISSWRKDPIVYELPRVPSLGVISCGNEHFPGSKNNHYPAEVLACFVVFNQYVLWREAW